MMLEITPDAQRALRARAHALDPVVTIGKDGLTDAVLHEIDLALKAHELIKVRVLDDERDTRDALLADIAQRQDAAPVQHIGKLFVLWRPKPGENSEKSEKIPPREYAEKRPAKRWENRSDTRSESRSESRSEYRPRKRAEGSWQKDRREENRSGYAMRRPAMVEGEGGDSRPTRNRSEPRFGEPRDTRAEYRPRKRAEGGWQENRRDDRKADRRDDNREDRPPRRRSFGEGSGGDFRPPRNRPESRFEDRRFEDRRDDNRGDRGDRGDHPSRRRFFDESESHSGAKRPEKRWENRSDTRPDYRPRKRAEGGWQENRRDDRKVDRRDDNRDDRPPRRRSFDEGNGNDFRPPKNRSESRFEHRGEGRPDYRREERREERGDFGHPRKAARNPARTSSDRAAPFKTSSPRVAPRKTAAKRTTSVKKKAF